VTTAEAAMHCQLMIKGGALASPAINELEVRRLIWKLVQLRFPQETLIELKKT